MPGNDQLDHVLHRLDKCLGYVAVFLQYIILAFVDPAAYEPDPDLVERYKYHGFRLGGHVVAFFVHFICASSGRQGLKLSIGSQKIIILVLALLIVCLLTTLHQFTLLYTLYCFLYSIIIAIVSWLLFQISATRKLVCLSGVEDIRMFSHLTSFGGCSAFHCTGISCAIVILVLPSQLGRSFFG